MIAMETLSLKWHLAKASLKIPLLVPTKMLIEKQTNGSSQKFGKLRQTEK